MTEYKSRVLKGVQKACIDCIGKALSKEGDKHAISFLKRYIKDITFQAEKDYVAFHYYEPKKEYTFVYEGIILKVRFEATSSSASEAIDKLLEFVRKFLF